MQVTVYKCDRCGADISKDEVVKAVFSYGKGNFDLRDEDYELCPPCYADAIKWMEGRENGGRDND